MENLLQKFIFRLCILNVTITDADFGSLKSLNTLFGKYVDHMLVKFDQNCMIQNVEFFWGENGLSFLR